MLKDEINQARMHMTMTPLNTRKYPLVSRDCNLNSACPPIIEGRFMGHLAKPAFAIPSGENSAAKKVSIGKTCGRSTLFNLARKNI